jgi:hypothetical protein
VTDPTARIIRDDYKGRVPRTPAEFASAFLPSGAAIENRTLTHFAMILSASLSVLLLIGKV